MSLDIRQENGKDVYYNEGKPLQGACKIIYIEGLFEGVRYSLCTFEEGVRGDTTRIYDYETDVLLKEEIRLGDGQTLHRRWFASGDFLAEEYRTVGDRMTGTRRQWYNDGKGTLWRESEYGEEGLTKRSSMDELGRITDRTSFRDGVPDGWAETWDYDDDSYERSLYLGGGSPRIINHYILGGNLDRRTVLDGSGEPLYSASKPDCDSTRIDTLETGFEIRDYKEGVLRSLERYTSDWVPDGLFEDFHPGGQILARQLFRDGELLKERYYDNGMGTPVSHARVTKLTEAEYRRLLGSACDSKSLRNSVDSGHDLVIRNRSGELLWERHSTENDWKSLGAGYSGRLNFAYYGYDEALKLHVAFSSYGDYNDVRFFIIPEIMYPEDGSEYDEEYLELPAECISVHGTTGRIAALVRGVTDTENRLSVYRRTDEGFLSLFDDWLELSSGMQEMAWISNHSLLVVGPDAYYRIDIDPKALAKAERSGSASDEGDI